MSHNASNVEAERSIIAAFLKKGIAEKHITRLTPEDFWDNKYRTLFTAMQALYIQKKHIDMVTMAEMLKHLVGNDNLMQTLFEIIANNSFGAEFALDEHIRIVKEKAKIRMLTSMFDNAVRQLGDPAVDVGAVVASVQDNLRRAQEAKNETSSLQEVLMSAFSELEERVHGGNKGMPSGIRVLDAKTAGFHKGEMTIIGARPAVGKSALAGQIAIGAAQNGNKVCMCSREMTDVQYGIRVLARGTKVSNMRIRTGTLTEEDWGQLTDSLMLYGDCDIRFMFNTKFIEDLRSEVQVMKEKHGLDMLIVDYIQLLQTKQRFDKDYQRIGYISKALKDMSTELNISVIALAQVGRSTEGEMPTLSELRGSGDLEQDADNVIFMHRPEDSGDKWIHPNHKSLFDTFRSMGSQYIVLSIAKQRQGETCLIPCLFTPRSMSFSGVKED